jgi:hypothetical protein
MSSIPSNKTICKNNTKRKTSSNTVKKYRVWDESDDKTLKKLYNNGLDIFQISACINRTPSAISGRLTKIKIIDEYYMARGYDKVVHRDNLNSAEIFDSIMSQIIELKNMLNDISENINKIK